MYIIYIYIFIYIYNDASSPEKQIRGRSSARAAVWALRYAYLSSCLSSFIPFPLPFTYLFFSFFSLVFRIHIHNAYTRTRARARLRTRSGIARIIARDNDWRNFAGASRSRVAGRRGSVIRIDGNTQLPARGAMLFCCFAIVFEDACRTSVDVIERGLIEDGRAARAGRGTIKIYGDRVCAWYCRGSSSCEFFTVIPQEHFAFIRAVFLLCFASRRPIRDGPANATSRLAKWLRNLSLSKLTKCQRGSFSYTTPRCCCCSVTVQEIVCRERRGFVAFRFFVSIRLAFCRETFRTNVDRSQFPSPPSLVFCFFFLMTIPRGGWQFNTTTIHLERKLWRRCCRHRRRHSHKSRTFSNLFFLFLRFFLPSSP